MFSYISTVCESTTGPATGCSTGCSTVNGVLNGLLNGTLYALRSRQASRCWDAITWPIHNGAFGTQGPFVVCVPCGEDRRRRLVGEIGDDRDGVQHDERAQRHSEGGVGGGGPGGSVPARNVLAWGGGGAEGNDCRRRVSLPRLLTMGTDRRVVIDQVCRRRCIQRQLAEFVPEDCLYTSYPFWLSATLCDHLCYLVMRERQHGLHEERKVRRLQLVADRSTRGLVLFAGHVRSAKIPKDLTVGLQFDTETAQRWPEHVFGAAARGLWHHNGLD